MELLDLDQKSQPAIARFRLVEKKLGEWSNISSCSNGALLFKEQVLRRAKLIVGGSRGQQVAVQADIKLWLEERTERVQVLG